MFLFVDALYTWWQNLLSGPSDAPPVIAMEYQNQLVFTVPIASRWEGPWPLGVGCALPAWMEKWNKASAHTHTYTYMSYAQTYNESLKGCGQGSNLTYSFDRPTNHTSKLIISIILINYTSMHCIKPIIIIWKVLQCSWFFGVISELELH